MTSNLELKNILDTIGEPIIILDVEGGEHFTFAILNLAAETYFGTSSKKYVGMSVGNIENLDETRAGQRQQSIELYKRCVQTKAPVVNETRHLTADGKYRWGRNTHAPIFDGKGEVHQIIVTSVDITELIESQQRLEDALTKTLSGFVTICSYCKNIRNDKGLWDLVEEYIGNHSEVEFSHGICPDCAQKHYPEFMSNQ